MQANLGQGQRREKDKGELHYWSIAFRISNLTEWYSVGYLFSVH